MSKEMSFVIFCIESYKNYRALTGRRTVEMFYQYDVISYLKEFYDVLHTTGYQHINRDIDTYLEKRGAIIAS